MGLMLNNQPIKGEVHLGKQTIGKIYYNHELVYENMLASGTVVFDETLNISGTTTTEITLKNVEAGMTNISKGLNVYFDIAGIGNDTQFVSVDDLKNGIILRKELNYPQKHMVEVLNLAWKAGTNQLYVRTLIRDGLRSLKLTVA